MGGETYVHIHPAWFAVMGTFFIALIGVLWSQHGRRLSKLEDTKVDIEQCKLKEQITREKSNAITQRMTDNNDSNRKDYISIMESIHKLCESQRATTLELNKMSTCLALLAAGVDCSDKT